jgi:hypothetical protein
MAVWLKKKKKKNQLEISDDALYKKSRVYRLHLAKLMYYLEKKKKKRKRKTREH